MYGVTSRSQIRKRLEVYDQIRHDRASSVQLLSSSGLDQGPHQDVEQYMEGNPVPGKVDMFPKSACLVAPVNANRFLPISDTPRHEGVGPAP